jgi:High potential iron-sulfur protein
MFSQSFHSPRSISMTTSSRRVFMMQVAAAGATTLLAARASAQTGALVADTDPQGVALGYKSDTTKVDAKKYPKHLATQNCANCALYQGKAADKAGGCPLFAGKQVAASGW